ncbi:acyltransferase [Mitsuaria sp. WAJ17]|uniref:acyltransferase family protein n=1 Tax=Mitsuaria sp. WAJ17 TaxID=2761452 RepID=UPI0016043DA0|nr:acyltransferase family protein [Mitsuaria sp. WAJ17]MBB2487716.1 acyltransferase [Mitsuaria sp. WAJ17]
MTPSHPVSLATAEPLRWDIQALRGLAVAWVLLHHAQLPGIAGGYLGVDVFFVISGYLITGLVQRALLARRFSFRDFYARRARRLLPAAYVTLALTLLASPWLLNAREQLDLAAQARGALLFASNWVLWQQSGYFQGAAELKPLLHFWSLSLEEQYYLLLPALLWLSPPRWRRLVVGLLCLASLALCVRWLTRDANLAFYALPSRAWELGLGSLVALHPRPWPVPAALRTGSAIALLVLPLLDLPGWPHPGPLALCVCLATALLVQHPAGPEAAPRGLRPLVWLGDRSYSLYLVHWPLMAAVHNAWVGTGKESPPELTAWRLAALGAALPLAWLLHRFVELPGKARLRGRPAWVALVLGSLSLALLPGLSQRWVQAPEGHDFARLTRPNYGFSALCDAERPYAPRPECQQGAQPRWMVWGDSYAMHLVPGLAHHLEAQGAPGLIQATKSSCGPFPGLGPYKPEAAPGATFAPRWVAQCHAFNAAVLEWLAGHPEVRTVLLSSLLTQYLDRRQYSPRRLTPQGLLSEQPLDEAGLHQALLDDLRRTVQRLRAMGRQVMLVAPPPRAGFNVPACLERRALGRWTLGATLDCRIDGAHRDASDEAVQSWLQQAGAVLPVLRFEPLLCRDGRCDVMRGGVMLYRDQGHLSEAGSVWLLPRLAWPAASAAQ